MKALPVLLLLASLGPGAAGRSAITPAGGEATNLSLSARGHDVVVDDARTDRVEFTAYWKRLAAGETRGAHGPTVLSDEGTGVDGVVRFTPALPRAGRYEVYLYWPALRDPAPGRRLATNAAVDVGHAGGSERFSVNMRRRPQEWLLLGAFSFEAGEQAFIEIRNDQADGIVLADAVRFRALPCPLNPAP